jgi:hypothetical protein
VPLGPPLLTYSSSCRATFAFNNANKCVELKVDRPYVAGQPVLAWCGPQVRERGCLLFLLSLPLPPFLSAARALTPLFPSPKNAAENTHTQQHKQHQRQQANRNLLVNYGFVDEDNPHDRMPLVATLDARDPLFKLKRAALAAAGLGTMQQFDLRPPPFSSLGLVAGMGGMGVGGGMGGMGGMGAGAAGAGAAGAKAAAGAGAGTAAAAAGATPVSPPSPPTLPPTLLPWLRLAAAQTEAQVKSCRVYGPTESAVAAADEERGARQDPQLHSAARGLLARELAARLAGYGRSLERDLEILRDDSGQFDPRERVAARLTKIERRILMAAREGVGGEQATLGGVGAVATAHQPTFKW